MTGHNVFREGKVHVLSRKCSTCILGPRNVIDEARVAGMVQEATERESTIVCHSTLGTDAHAACRGFFDLSASATLRLAVALDLVAWQDPPEKLPNRG